MPARSALQINLHPLDAPFVPHTLKHQLDTWGHQVDRVVLTVDTKRSRNGRYRGSAYEDNRKRLFDEIEGLARRFPKIELAEVDYSSSARDAVRQRYFATSADYPEKAFDGGPFHAYFYGLLRADADYVLHMDGDMLFGGGSRIWLEEAINWLESTPDALFASPLPGPPRPDGSLGNADRHVTNLAPQAPERIAADYPAYRFKTVSTRIFVLDQRRFDERIGALDIVRPNAAQQLRARIYRQLPHAVPAEVVFTAAIVRHGLCRVDFLGAEPGMYSLHPPYRSETFYRELPRLIARVAAGDIPLGQLGDFDLNASMIDWTDAIRQKSRSRRLARALLALLPS